MDSRKNGVIPRFALGAQIHPPLIFNFIENKGGGVCLF